MVAVKRNGSPESFQHVIGILHIKSIESALRNQSSYFSLVAWPSQFFLGSWVGRRSQPTSNLTPVLAPGVTPVDFHGDWVVKVDGFPHQLASYFPACILQ